MLPISGKTFERLIFNKMFRFFISNNIFPPNQSGFKSGDSCINQSISNNLEIYKSSDNGLESRGVFLDISKALNKVWHERLIFKWKQNGTSGGLLYILFNFLSNRKQTVVLHGKNLPWVNVHVGDLQESVLGPLLFLKRG